MKKFVPKKKQKFRAFLKVEMPGKEHVGSPFVCIGTDARIVMATDKNDMLCILGRREFSFDLLADGIAAGQ